MMVCATGAGGIENKGIQPYEINAFLCCLYIVRNNKTNKLNYY